MADNYELDQGKRGLSLLRHQSALQIWKRKKLIFKSAELELRGSFSYNTFPTEIYSSEKSSKQEKKS